MIQSLYLTSHPPYLYLCDLTLCIGGKMNTVCMISHILYVWYIMHYIRHHTHALWHHSTLFMMSKLLYLTSHPLYLIAHPLYQCHHTQIITHITPIVRISESNETHCVQTRQTIYLSSHNRYLYLCDHTHSTCLLYAWHHMNYRWHPIHSVRYHTTLWHHTHCIHVITPSISDVASTVAASLVTVYWLYYIYSMCDIKTTICMTSYELYVTSHPIYMTSHTLYLWHHSPCFYEKTPAIFLTSYTVYMASRMVYEWQHNHCIWHHTHCIYIITLTWLIILHPLYVWNHTHHRHFIWHHIHSWWHHTIVCMSWHPLCLWHHILYIWCHTHCVWHYKIYIWLETILSVITSTVYVIIPTLSKTSHQLC